MNSSDVTVLLISPRLESTDKRYGGDYGYTDLMLEYPPTGINYLHYEDLILRGDARKSLNYHRIGSRLKKYGVLPPDYWGEYIDVDLVPDLIHIYGFSARVNLTAGPRHDRIPIILGTSTGSYSDLKYYLGWPDQKIERYRNRKRNFLKLINAHDTSLRPEHAVRVLVWSEFAATMHLEDGIVLREQLEVLPPGLNQLPRVAPDTRPQRTVTFLYIGSDFERKNGQMVLDAFRFVRADFPDTRLILIGKPRDGRTFTEPGVEHHHFVPRSQLLTEIYQAADVLVLPSKAEGFGLVLVEAMSAGLATIAVRAWAMPEIVDHEQTGFLIRPENLQDLIMFMRTMAENPCLVRRMQVQSYQRYLERFSVESHNRRLSKIYGDVLAMNSQQCI